MVRLRSRSSAGFTLLELLVVIAIIAILAEILFPVFASAAPRRAAARAGTPSGAASGGARTGSIPTEVVNEAGDPVAQASIYDVKNLRTPLGVTDAKGHAMVQLAEEYLVKGPGHKSLLIYTGNGDEYAPTYVTPSQAPASLRFQVSPNARRWRWTEHWGELLGLFFAFLGVVVPIVIAKRGP